MSMQCHGGRHRGGLWQAGELWEVSDLPYREGSVQRKPHTLAVGQGAELGCSMSAASPRSCFKHTPLTTGFGSCAEKLGSQTN